MPAAATDSPGDTQKPVFKTYSKPSDKYVDRSCAADLSRLDNFESYVSVRGCGSEVITFSVPLSKRKVSSDGLGGWPSWGAPPFTEDKTPHLLASDPATTVTLSFTRRVKIGGLEIQPAGDEPQKITAHFHRLVDGGGKKAGTVSRTVSGDHGARLFAIKAGEAFDENAGFYSIVITSDAPFAVAQLRT